MISIIIMIAASVIGGFCLGALVYDANYKKDIVVLENEIFALQKLKNKYEILIGEVDTEEITPELINIDISGENNISFSNDKSNFKNDFVINE